MKTARTEFFRTLSKLFFSRTLWVSFAVFLAASGALFTRLLEQGEGGSAGIPALWALSAALPLVVFTAIATMRLLTGTGGAGRFDLLLAAPVIERDVVLGRFWGAFLASSFAVLIFWISSAILLPEAANAGVWSFLPALFILLLQAALGCATGLWASARCRDSAIAAALSLIILVALPEAIFRTAFAWIPSFRARVPQFPFESHLSDFAAGLISTGIVAFYVFATALALFAASKTVAMFRFSGRGARPFRVSSRVTVAFAAVFTTLAILLAFKLDATFTVGGYAAEGFSARTYSILSEGSGDVRATCFLSRNDPLFIRASRLLRQFDSAARAASGVRLSLEFVDPRWDLAGASRLVRSGVPESSIVISRGRRRVVVPSAEANEAVIASAIFRLGIPAGRESVYFTEGHGEGNPENHNEYTGLSDLSRILKRDGYSVKSVNLADAGTVPGDCAVLVIAGARTPFAPVEVGWMDGYVKNGGRLLVLAGDEDSTGLQPLFSSLGIDLGPQASSPARTINGANILVDGFADHAVTRPLAGTSVVFSRSSATILMPGQDESAGRDRSVFTPLATARTASGDAILAAAVERGAGVSSDLGFRPSRVVVVGDPSFADNGSISSRGNANGDFLMNAISWLAGVDALGASGISQDIVFTGMDRSGRARFLVLSSVVVPVIVLLAGFLFRRRRR